MDRQVGRAQALLGEAQAQAYVQEGHCWPEMWKSSTAASEVTPHPSSLSPAQLLRACLAHGE